MRSMKYEYCTICGGSVGGALWHHYRQEHPEIRRSHSSRCEQYRRNSNKRREMRKRAWYRDMVQEPCIYCGKDPAGTVDHKTPLVRGGSNTRENTVPCCKKCNNKKGRMTYSEYMKQVEKEN